MKNSYEEALEGLETLKRENKNLQRELNVMSSDFSAVSFADKPNVVDRMVSHTVD